MWKGEPVLNERKDGKDKIFSSVSKGKIILPQRLQGVEYNKE